MNNDELNDISFDILIYTELVRKKLSTKQYDIMLEYAKAILDASKDLIAELESNLSTRDKGE